MQDECDLYFVAVKLISNKILSVILFVLWQGALGGVHPDFLYYFSIVGTNSYPKSHS